MSVGTFLTHILIVLVAAKVAAEVSERIGLPAVVGEILAGLLIGPSALNLVAGDEVLTLLGEIGVILLLLDVGLEMDIGEFRAVGRSSILVAVTGVVVPMVAGLGAMEVLFDEPFNTALFIGAALTATSVGITARVFGDLRALATPEARTVLGAAVADDVMGLIVLTVVVRLVTDGSVSLGGIAAIIGVALLFLVAGSFVGLKVAPPMFRLVERLSRSGGTMVAVAFAFALAFAKLADVAKLAPIVGAFVAGLALARSDQSERIRRELAPVGHLFIPVFFLQIGAEAELSAFAKGAVLRDAAVLLVVAVVGKLVASVGAFGAPGDKWLIGIGMIPRGEVGLIFATIGRQQGVLDDDLYAALLLVVLVTTLITPPLLRWRLSRLRAAETDRRPAPSSVAPVGGWLRLEGHHVTLAAIPPDDLALPLALDAARLVADAKPSPELLDWLGSVPETSLRWTPQATDSFLRLLGQGNARSWRFLEVAGLLDDAVPELAETLRRRHADPFETDPTAAHRWVAIERVQHAGADDPLSSEINRLEHREWLLLAALLVEAMQGRSAPKSLSHQIIRRLDLGPTAERFVAALVEDADLLWSSSRRPESFTEESVLQLASHLDQPELARALYVLSVARAPDASRWELDRVGQLHGLLQAALTDPDLSGSEARNLVGRRRTDAIVLAGGDEAVIARIMAAPRAYVLSTPEPALVGHARMLFPLPERGTARVEVRALDGVASAVNGAVVELDGTAGAEGSWQVSIAARDQPGLLAAVTRALADAGLNVSEAVVAGWADGAAIESFVASSASCPDPASLVAAIEAAFPGPLEAPPLPDATVSFDNSSSPWHTVCTVSAPDRPGLLHALASVFAAAEIEVRSARIGASGGLALDRFELNNDDGHKLTIEDQAAVLRFVEGGVIARRRRHRRGWQARVVANTGSR